MSYTGGVSGPLHVVVGPLRSIPMSGDDSEVRNLLRAAVPERGLILPTSPRSTVPGKRPLRPHGPLGPGSVSPLPGPSPRPFERTRGIGSLLPATGWFQVPSARES